MTVQYKDVASFPGYSVGSNGEIISDKTGKSLSPALNQQGIASVGLFIEGIQHRRSVAILVAEAFLGDPPNERFDTPIHLDGDKSNNNADNLEWRPRWFAIKYHKQFHDPFIHTHASWMVTPIEVVQTGEQFDHAIDCCKKYGLLVSEVVLAAYNGGIVFPVWYEFRIWEK